MSVEGKVRTNPKSQVSKLIEDKVKLVAQLEDMMFALAKRDAEISQLNATQCYRKLESRDQVPWIISKMESRTYV